MNMSFGKFLGLAGILVVAYFVYNTWWGDQDQDSWIERFNKWVFSSEDEIKENSGEEPDTGVKSESDAWTN